MQFSPERSGLNLLRVVLITGGLYSGTSLYCEIFYFLGTCPNGEDGVCGSSSKFTCRSGTSCRFLRKGITDAVGKCCIDNPKEGSISIYLVKRSQ